MAPCILVSGELILNLLACQHLVNTIEGGNLVLEVILLLGVEEHSVGDSAVGVDTGPLSDDLNRIAHIIEESLVHSGQSSPVGPLHHLGLTPGLSLALADNHNMLSVFLLQFANKSVVGSVDLTEMDEGNKDHNNLLIGLLDVQLAGSGESQRLQVSPELLVVDLEIEQGLCNLLLELGGLLAFLCLFEFPFSSEHDMFMCVDCFVATIAEVDWRCSDCQAI